MTEKKKYKKWLKLDDKMMFAQLPFALFLTGLGIVYIANSYYVDGTVLEMNKLNKDISKIKNEFVITKTELSLKGQRKQIMEKVDSLGIKESKTPPYSIVKD